MQGNEPGEEMTGERSQVFIAGLERCRSSVICARAWPRQQTVGFISRQVVIASWLVLAASVIVDNFADSQSAGGAGLWWVTIGLIVSLGRSLPSASRRGAMT
jgi:hypothetical protein